MSALDCDLIDLATYNYEKYPQINSQVSRKKKRKVKKKKKKKKQAAKKNFFILQAFRRYQPPYSEVHPKTDNQSTSSSSIPSHPPSRDTKEAAE
jgi:hypothetical protein